MKQMLQLTLFDLWSIALCALFCGGLAGVTFGMLMEQRDWLSRIANGEYVKVEKKDDDNRSGV